LNVCHLERTRHISALFHADFTFEMSKFVFAILFAGLTLLSVGAQDEESDCPERDGLFADSIQCDRYYECDDFELTEKLCADGLVFSDDGSVGSSQCDYPFNVDCEDRKELQPAQSSANCPRANGYFPHPISSICNQFYFCSDGQYNLITCAAGLVFDPNKGVCQYPGEANREGCTTGDVVDFQCPEAVQEEGSRKPVVANPLYRDPTSCQFFYVCINNKEPRRNGCPQGSVFNPLAKKCDHPKNVPECADFYNKDEEEEEEEEFIKELGLDGGE